MTSNAHKEIERKFLVTECPSDLEIGHGTALLQGYLSIDPERMLSVRIRKATTAVMTIKQGRGISRTEVEVPLTSDQFDVLWPLSIARLRKRRHVVEVEGHRIELDIFEDSLAGLQLAEVEFTSIEEAHAFVPPRWFGRDVTEDPLYLNQTLAVQGRPDHDEPLG